ncbi:hypothetical protein EDB83DRAFT_183618 [Lactarius deliciosus]|nr:hypothetical protein EDB83DRAFT_183618 [Lactarius deliciosus]
MRPYLDPVASKVGSKYEDCFLRVHIKGDFIEEDMNSNKIVAAYIVPDFVKNEMLAKAEPFVGNAAWEKYFDNLTADQEIRFPANKREVNHLIHISSVDVEKSWDPLMEESPRYFKEDDANWLFFYALAHRFRPRIMAVLVDHPGRETLFYLQSKKRFPGSEIWPSTSDRGGQFESTIWTSRWFIPPDAPSG